MANSPAKALTLADLGGNLIIASQPSHSQIGDSLRVEDTAMPAQIPQSVHRKLFPLNPISAHHPD
jgi:hypothetical protein